MFSRLEKIASAIIMVASLIFIPRQIVEATGSETLGRAVLFAITAVLGLSILHYLFPQPYHFRFGLGRFRVKALVPRRLTRIRIDATFGATVIHWREYIWLAKPRQSEMVDLIDVPTGLDMSEASFQSADSVPSDIVRKGPHKLAVFWQGYETPEAYVPYHHHMQYVPASLYGDDAFWHAFHVDRETGVAKFHVRSHHPLEHAMAFLLPPLVSKVTSHRIYLRSIGMRSRRCIQPQMSADCRTVTWELRRPEIGRTYVLVGFYEGGQKRFESYARAPVWWRTAWSRLRVRVRPIGGVPTDRPSAGPRECI